MGRPVLLVALLILTSGCLQDAPAPVEDDAAAEEDRLEPGRLVADDFEANGSAIASVDPVSCSPGQYECEGFPFMVRLEGDPYDLVDGLNITVRLEWVQQANSFLLRLTDEEGRPRVDGTPDGPTAMVLHDTLRAAGIYVVNVRPDVVAADDFHVTVTFEPAPGAAG